MAKRRTRPACVLVIHGPNLNLLGTREPGLYGRETLANIDAELRALGAELGIVVEIFQSNHEGAIVDRIHAARERCAGLIVNGGGLSHTSVVLRDAVTAVGLPTIEVHLTNTHAREPWRHGSLLGGVCVGRIEGLGALGYRLALRALAERGSGHGNIGNARPPGI